MLESSTAFWLLQGKGIIFIACSSLLQAMCNIYFRSPFRFQIAGFSFQTSKFQFHWEQRPFKFQIAGFSLKHPTFSFTGNKRIWISVHICVTKGWGRLWGSRGAFQAPDWAWAAHVSILDVSECLFALVWESCFVDNAKVEANATWCAWRCHLHAHASCRLTGGSWLSETDMKDQKIPEKRIKDIIRKCLREGFWKMDQYEVKSRKWHCFFIEVAVCAFVCTMFFDMCFITVSC